MKSNTIKLLIIVAIAAIILYFVIKRKNSQAKDEESSDGSSDSSEGSSGYSGGYYAEDYYDEGESDSGFEVEEPATDQIINDYGSKQIDHKIISRRPAHSGSSSPKPSIPAIPDELSFLLRGNNREATDEDYEALKQQIIRYNNSSKIVKFCRK